MRLRRSGDAAELALEDLQNSLRPVAQLVGRLIGGFQGRQEGLQLLERQLEAFEHFYDTLYREVQLVESYIPFDVAPFSIVSL